MVYQVVSIVVIQEDYLEVQIIMAEDYLEIKVAQLTYLIIKHKFIQIVLLYLATIIIIQVEEVYLEIITTIMEEEIYLVIT